MSSQRIAKIISKAFSPIRVFIALILVVSFWLLFTFIPNETPNAFGQGFVARGGACGGPWSCGDNECCYGGACLSKSDSKCGSGGDPNAPVITGVLNCVQDEPRSGNWCHVAPSLEMTASDPNGLAVMITGLVAAWNPFACPQGLTCTIDLAPYINEGEGQIVFFAKSALGQGIGSVVYDVDYTTPLLTVVPTPLLPGANDWYTSPVTLTASATDALSGVAALEYLADGGQWVAYTAPVTLGYGTHTIQFRARDKAGNESKNTLNIKIASPAAPQIDAQRVCSQEQNGWCIGSLSFNVSAEQLPGQTLNVFGNVNGKGFSCPPGAASCSVDVTTNGPGTIAYRVDSDTGVWSQESQSYKLDNSPPVLDAPLITCLTPGNDGWCKGGLSLNITASDPEVQNDIIISGNLYDSNGAYLNNFGCPEKTTSCQVNSSIPQGTGRIDYQALSVPTGLATSGSVTYKLDTSTPSLSGGFNPTAADGNNGWYKSNVTFTVTATDLISGIGLTEITANNGTSWTPYSSPVIFTDGRYEVNIRTTDKAGNPNVPIPASQSLRVDTTSPTISAKPTSGTGGHNDWYISPVTITPSARDDVSGLASLEVRTDGNAYTAYTDPIVFGDGIHTYQFHGKDNAGNETETTLQTVYVDTTKPTIATSINPPKAYNNGWFVSAVTITPNALDGGSGIDFVEVSKDGTWSVIPNNSPVTFEDGIHTYKFRATDKAGNSFESVERSVSVDTVTPAISLDINGKWGENGWYVSNVTVTPKVSDSTSGIDSIEASADGGMWKTLDSLTFTDGRHEYQFRVTDKAGNTTTLPPRKLAIDTLFPAIDMTDTLTLGDTLYYSIEDPSPGLFLEHSGLHVYRAVIEDEDEKYKKIVWLEDMSGNKEKGEILWDGKFADGTKAGVGEYFITLKIKDAAGNETMKTAVVTVDLKSLEGNTPAFIPPVSAPEPDPTTPAAPTPETFGNVENKKPVDTDTITIEEGGGTNGAPVVTDPAVTSEGGGSNNIAAQVISNVGGVILTLAENVKTALGFNVQSANTDTSPLTPGNVLWGAAAAAMIGATLEEWRKKSEEEERQLAEAEAARNEEERKQAEERASILAEPGEASANVWTVGPVTTKPVSTAQTTPGVLWGEAAAAYVGTIAAEWEKERQEEKLRRAAEDNDDKASNNYHDKIRAKQMADITRVEENKKAELAIQALDKQTEENRAAMQKAAAIAALDKQELENKAAMQTAEEAARQKTLEDFRAGEREENLLFKNPINSLGLSPTNLVAKYQQNQGQTNYCGSYAISTALNMLYGTNTTGMDTVNAFAQDYGIFRLSRGWPVLSWLPNGSAILPYQQSLIVNTYSSQILGQRDNLPTAEVKNLTKANMISLISDPNKGVLLTYNTVKGSVSSGHVVVLAAYDPARGFGFLNSGAERSANELTWKTIDQMDKLLEDPIGLENPYNPNFVIISKP